MYENNLIYCLKCPFTNNVHYVGKSTQGLLRPTQHFKNSHSKKISEWVDDIKILGYKPIIEILESNIPPNEIVDKEKYWIAKYLKNGSLLLNSSCVSYATIINEIIINNNLTDDNDIFDNTCEKEDDNILMKKISKIIKENRKKHNLTQPELSSKLNIGLRWLRKIESSNNSIMLNHLEKLLKAFNLKLIVVKKDHQGEN